MIAVGAARRDGLGCSTLVAALLTGLTIAGVTAWRALQRDSHERKHADRSDADGLGRERNPGEARPAARRTPASNQRKTGAPNPAGAPRPGANAEAAERSVEPHRLERPGAAEPAPASASSAWLWANETARRERELPWRLPGQCKNEDRTDAIARLRYLASFVPAEVGPATVYAHRDAPAEAIAVVHRDIASIHEKASEYTGLRARPAAVYVHPSADALREHSCSGGNAVAYYDGAIHVAADVAPAKGPAKSTDRFEDEMQKSLMHEYVHHVLVHNGIGRPIWLQEAMAMEFAAEPYFDHRWVERPLELADMVDVLPSTAAPEVEQRYYPQAQGMFWFLKRLCGRREHCVKDLPQALIQGRALPETLFEWAISDRARELLPATPANFWRDYVARGEAFPEGFSAALAARPPN